MKGIAYISLFMLVLTGCKEKDVSINAVEKKIETEKEMRKEMRKEKEKKKDTLSLPFYDLQKKPLTTIHSEIFQNNQAVAAPYYNERGYFPEQYTEIEGVLTFRGNHLRTSPAFGEIRLIQKKMNVKWTFQTNAGSWGGGAGWTGQASLIKWENNVKNMMNIYPEFKEKTNFVEVVYASLDGNIYFLELESGKKTRSPISIGNPIKGSVSLDPRGYPLLYVGQGIPEKGSIGYRVFSLIDGKLLAFIPGMDPIAYRGWGAFDGAPLINRLTDTMILGGENGLFYITALHTTFDQKNKTIKVDPTILKYRYKISGNPYQGIENSVAVYKNLAFFSDNGGSLQAVDLMNLHPIWALEKTDDTDATIVVDVEEKHPYLYTGTEVDKQGSKGVSLLRKIDALTGETIWKKEIPAFSLVGDDPVNGGLLATPIVGKKDIKNLVIFTISRYKTFQGGLLVAYDKQTGKEVWRNEMPNYAWSSPVDVYDKKGNAFIIQGDSIGNLYLIDGKSGVVLDTVLLNGNIEASPVVYKNELVVATRGGTFYGISLN
jgi:hypothetical protein